MNRNTQMRNDRAPVNQQVKLLVKAKRQKFISTQFPCMHVDRQELSKQAHSRDKRRRENNVHKKPVWETWGTTDYHQQNGIGLFGNEEVFGNHLSGQQWVEQQKRRQKQFIVQPGQIKSIAKQNAEQTQYTYIQPATPEQKLDFLRRRGYQFEDCDFPPNNNSLNGQYGIDSEWEVIQWKRIRFMIPNAAIFEGKVQPTDIKQGYLGDCYFLAGLAALAERPDRIFNLFLLKQRNELSFFSVKILYKGKWRMVDLDDSVPFVFSTPAFSRTVNGQLWVVLLEKAWAKIYGSYKNIQAGFPEQPLHDLTGAPIKQLYLTHKSYKTDQQWKYLIEASLKQYAMVASSNTDGDQHISQTGIFRAHAYTFLNAIQIETRSGKQRVVQLRNTWGRGQFKGKWADDHPIWDQVSQQDKYRVRYKKDVEDGIFFMEFDDFTKQFRIITVAEISDNSSYVYESSYDPDKKGVYFTLKILHQANYCLQVDKTPQRSLCLQKQKSYRYPQSMLEIGRINETSSQMLQGCSERRKTMFKTHKLFPGQYVVYVKINFDSKYEQDFDVTLAVYSDFTCGISISTQQEVYKLTGKKNEWDGIKKTKPPKPVLPFEVRSTTFIETKQKKSSISTSKQGEEQVEDHTQSQVVKKSYRNQTEFERKNPLIMFGFHNIIAEQTPCYKHAVGELQQNWNSKQKDKRKSNSKSRQKVKITTTTNSSLESATVQTNLIVNQLGKKAEELRSKSRESRVVQSVKVVQTKGKQLMVEKQKQMTVVHKEVNRTVEIGYNQEHFDGRSYKLVKKEQQTVEVDVRQIRKVGQLVETQKKQTIKQQEYRIRENIVKSKQLGIEVKTQQKSQKYQMVQQTNKHVKQTKKVNKTQNCIKQINTEQATTTTIRGNPTDLLIRNEQMQSQSQTQSRESKNMIKQVNIQKQNQNIQSVCVNNGRQGKIKSKPYAEDIIQNVLGFTTSYRKEYHGQQQGGKQEVLKQHSVRKQVKVTVFTKMQTDQRVEFKSSTIEQTKIAQKIPEYIIATQNKLKNQTKQTNMSQKVKIEQQNGKNEQKEVKKMGKEKINTESEEYQKQKEVRDSLKKRRRHKDILKYPQQNTQNIVNNIIFDLWPKIKH